MEFVKGEESTQDLKSRLDTAWKGEKIAESCGILIEEVMPRCARWLLNKFRPLSQEDCEDCFNDGVEGLLKQEPGQVNDPYNYLFTSAKNSALDIIRERKLIVRYDPRLARR